MSTTSTLQSHPSAPERGGDRFVAWLRELKECHAGGLVTDEDFGFQRAEKLSELLRPLRFLGIANFLGAWLTGSAAACTIWALTHDWQYTAGIGVLSAGWGFLALGRFLREKFIDLQLRERRRILVALLENDLLDGNEFADYDERLAQGSTDVLRSVS